MLCDAGRGIPGVPHLGPDSSARNSPQLAHQRTSVPHCEQYWSPEPRSPPHWRHVIVVVIPLLGEAPPRRDTINGTPAAGSAIGLDQVPPPAPPMNAKEA